MRQCQSVLAISVDLTTCNSTFGNDRGDGDDQWQEFGYVGLGESVDYSKDRSGRNSHFPPALVGWTFYKRFTIAAIAARERLSQASAEKGMARFARTPLKGN